MISLKEALLPDNRGIVSFVGAGGKTSLMFRIAGELSQEGQTVLTTTSTKIYPPAEDQSAHMIVSNSLEEIIERAGHVLAEKRHVTAAAGFITSKRKLKGFSPEFIENIYNTGMFEWVLVEADGSAGKPLKAPASHEPNIPQSSRSVVGLIGLECMDKPLTEEWVFRSELFAEITGLHPGEKIDEQSIADLIMHPCGLMKACPGGAERILFLNQADCPDGMDMGRRIVRILQKTEKCELDRVIIGNVLKSRPIAEYYDATF